MLDLKELQEALNTSDKIVKEYDDSYIYGKYGKLYAVMNYWYMFITNERNWARTKSKLDFMSVHNDGDDEGILKLDRYPTKSEANKIRQILGLKKKKEYTSEQLEEMRARLSNNFSRNPSSPP